MPIGSRGLMALLLVVGAAAWLEVSAAANTAPSECAQCRYDFGNVTAGTIVEHPFVLQNDGDQPLRIAGVQLSPPLQLAKMPAAVPPKDSAAVKLSLDTSNLEGAYTGKLVVMFSNPLAPTRTFSVTGHVSAAIEVLPRPAFFLSTQKGVAKSSTLEIINHEATPLTLKLRPRLSSVHQVEIAAIKPGQRYRLTLTVPAGAPTGRNSERLELQTSSAAQPILYIGANSIVRDRVYTFPDVVDFGRLSMRQLKSTGTGKAGAVQTLMVYQPGGRDFKVKASSRHVGVIVSAEPGPKGDRAQITISLLPSKLAPGRIRSTITVQTNDRAFPTLTIPVTGEILAD